LDTITDLPAAEIDGDEETPKRPEITDEWLTPRSWDWAIDTLDPESLTPREKDILKARFVQLYYLHGHPMKAAKECGLAFKTFKRWASVDPQFQDAMDEVREQFGYDGEALLVQMTRNPKATDRARTTAAYGLTNTHHKDYQAKATQGRGDINVNLIMSAKPDEPPDVKRLPATASHEIDLDADDDEDN
jgi:hypothetical protein